MSMGDLMGFEKFCYIAFNGATKQISGKSNKILDMSRPATWGHLPCVWTPHVLELVGQFPGTSYNLLYDQQKLPVRTRQNMVVFPTTFFAENPVRFLRAALDSRPRKRHGFVSAVTLRSCKQTSYVGFIMAWRSQIPIDQWQKCVFKRDFQWNFPVKKGRFVDRKLVQVNDDAASHVWITEGRNQPDHTTEISTVLYTIHLCDTFYSTGICWDMLFGLSFCLSLSKTIHQSNDQSIHLELQMHICMHMILLAYVVLLTQYTIHICII